MKSVFVAAAVLVVAVVAGCGQQKIEAYVECRNAGAKLGEGFACTIEHRAGTKAIHTCWKADIGCQNGTKGTGQDCGDVDPHAKSSVLMPYATFGGTLDKCDKVTSMNVTAISTAPK